MGKLGALGRKLLPIKYPRENLQTLISKCLNRIKFVLLNQKLNQGIVTGYFTHAKSPRTLALAARLYKPAKSREIASFRHMYI